MEGRRDCVAFVSPHRSATVGVANTTTATDNVVDAFDLCPSSSYVVFDSCYKQMYDKYNDVFRFVPMNGDNTVFVLSLDQVREPFFSPAGFNRGNVRGAIKVSYNPKSRREIDFIGQELTQWLTSPAKVWFSSVIKLLLLNQVRLTGLT